MVVAKKQDTRYDRSPANKILAAAMAIPGLATVTDQLQAQTAPAEPIAQLKYGYYEDYQSGDNGDRMDVHAPMLYLRAPILEDLELEAGAVVDSMSGASPLYYSVLSGASGKGIKDTRKAGDIKVTKYFSSFSLGLGGQISDEDDYLSRGGLIEARYWTQNKNTIFALGVSGDSDQISSTNNSELFEKRRTENYLLGITQVLTPDSIVQSNVTFESGSGFHSDPYKSFENRPESRDAVAWLTRYRHYIEATDAAVHLDYRLFNDSWSMLSHMVELAWYQPLGENWMLRPSLRYYSQNAAEFFMRQFPPESFDTFLTADQRLGAFGSLGAGIKVERELGSGFAIDASFNFAQQRDNWRLDGPSNPEIKDFSMRFFVLGLTKRFL